MSQAGDELKGALRDQKLGGSFFKPGFVQLHLIDIFDPTSCDVLDFISTSLVGDLS